jgi:hypothetical protein
MTPPTSRLRAALSNRLAWALLALLLVALHARSLWFYTEEDAYILARYARNLARGVGLVYNVGEAEWGCTTTLLPLLLVPLQWLGLSPVVGAKLVGVGSTAWAAFTAARIAARHAPSWLAAAAIVPVAAFGPLILWSVGGLETALAAALVLAALHAALDERDQPARRVPPSALWLLAATLARDDAPLFAPAILLAGFDGDWRRWLRWSLLFGGGFAALWGAHAWYYDAWLPNSFLSKVRGIPNRHQLGAEYVRSFAAELRPLLLTTAAAAVAALAWRRSRRDVAALLAAIASLAVYSWWAGGDWMPGYRFLAPAVLFAAPILVWAVAALPSRPLAAIGGAGLLALSVVTWRHDTDWMPRLHVLRTANDVFLRVGEAARGGDPTLTYALVDIGGFGWESEARVLDLRGLTDHRIAGAPNSAGGPIAAEVIESRQPDVVLVKCNVQGDADALRQFYDAVLMLDREPMQEAMTLLLLRRALSRGDLDAAHYLQRNHYVVINIPVFPEMGQFYIVAARADALSRLPPALSKARFNTGIAYYEMQSAKDNALNRIQAELAANPWDELGRLDQSNRLLAARRTPEALALLEELVKLAPYNADAYNNLGFARAVAGQLAEAVPALEKALRLRPDFPLAQRNLAWVRSGGR